jgi:hypothetical protein
MIECEAIGEEGRWTLEANQNKSWDEIPKPLLPVPLSAEPDAKIRGLLEEGWVTVIRLPIRPDSLDQVDLVADILGINVRNRADS